MIIGVTGTNGAGKGEVAEYLVKKKGFKHFSSRAYIVEEIKKQELPINRDTMTSVSNAVRKEHGATYFVKKMFVDIVPGEDVVIESVREVPSAHFIHEHGGFIIGVDADSHLRYERAVKRASETDHVSHETFIEQEKREMTSTDPTKQNISGVMAEADATLTNNGSMEELHAQIDAALARFRQV